MNEMRAVVANILKCRAQDLPSTAALGETPGWDSFAHLNIMLALEQRYAIAITDESIRAYSTLSAIECLAMQAA